jgi:hypothetical protein
MPLFKYVVVVVFSHLGRRRKKKKEGKRERLWIEVYEGI